jgi:hypothetical protein
MSLISELFIYFTDVTFRVKHRINEAYGNLYITNSRIRLRNYSQLSESLKI